MAKKERKPDTLKQKKARHYVKIILGVYLIYTAYNIVKDMRAGIEADNPALFFGAAALFLVVGAVLTITSFRAAMKISAEELKEKEDAQPGEIPMQVIQQEKPCEETEQEESRS